MPVLGQLDLMPDGLWLRKRRSGSKLIVKSEEALQQLCTGSGSGPFKVKLQMANSEN